MSTVTPLQVLADQAAQDTTNFGRYYPTIFVACGGTGAKVFQRIRRQTVERFGSLESGDLPGVAYISIDTDVSSQQAKNQDQDFGELNRVLDFRSEERLNLDGSGVQHSVSSKSAIENQPHIAEWFDPLLLETAKGMDISKGAGQIRPVARLVAFDNREKIVAAFNHAYRAVTSIRSDDQRVISGDKVIVVICGSLAGGTGSGVFLDVAAMIRDAQPNVVITGMFVLPSVFATADGQAKLKANGYAALSELNYYSTEPFRVRWDSAARPTVLPVLYNHVYVFDATNEGGQTISEKNGPNDIYDVIGDALFLDFFQGGFSFARNSVQVNRTQVLLKLHKVRKDVGRRQFNINLGSEPPITSVEMESFRQRFVSMGLSRVAVSSWRTLNRLSYWLAMQLIDFLDNREELIRDEIPLKREFAQKLGIFQGETTTEDGLGAIQRQLEVALMENPTDRGGQASLGDAISLHFSDLTTDDARDQWWDEKTCGQELRKRAGSMSANWAGAFDDSTKGAYAERLLINRRALFAGVSQRLAGVIEEFCERPDVGPHRIAQVMRRLVEDIRTSEVYWIKEMEKGAEQARTDAERLDGEWRKWSSLAAEADSSMLARLRKGAWQEQLLRASEVAVQYWNAVARRKMLTEGAGLLREVCDFIDREGVARQELLATRLVEIRTTFAAFDKEYARPRKSDVFLEIDLGDDAGFDRVKDSFLGNTQARRAASLRHLFGRVQTYLGIRTNKELRDRVESKKEAFVRELRYCCWLALKGTGGSTDWFGGKATGLIEAESVLDHLLKRYGGPNAPQIVELAQEYFKKALPWIKPYDGVNVRGIVRDCYVVLPKATLANQAVADAFFRAVSNEAAKIPNMNVARIPGSDESEILIYIETSGLIPASLSSLHSTTGMYAAYKQLIARRKDGDVMAFLHLDRDIVRYPRLVPMRNEDADKVVNAWKWFLLGVITGVIRTKRNLLRLDREEQATHPVFYFEYASGGSNRVVELGQWRSAVDDIGDQVPVQGQLQEMVNREYVNQPVARYERLLALVRYYKYCVFPVRKVDPDEGHDDTKSAPVAYLALDHLEQELLTQWADASGSDARAVAELMSHEIPKLMWGIGAYAQHTGQKDEDAALVTGLGDDQYYEQPPTSEIGEDSSNAERRRDLRKLGYELLPVSHRPNAALWEQARFYPWLRLAPRFRFHLPSKQGGSQAITEDPRRNEKLTELSIREVVAHFLATPGDTNANFGAKHWHHPPGRRGEFVPWSTIKGLREEFERRGGVVDTSAVPSPPRPGGGSAPSPGFYYSGPQAPEPTLATAARVAEYVRDNPGGPHWVLVNQQWVSPEQVPELALPAPRSSPPPPPVLGLPPLPGVPPLPARAALPPIPPGPFHYVGGPHVAWTELSGKQVVECALGLPAGQEGHVVADNAAVPVMQVPDLAAAIQARAGARG